MKKEWSDQDILYIDSGDIFQGGYESKLISGTIMLNFFKKAGLRITTLGNHEFDYGKEFIQDKLKKMDK